MIVLVDLTTTSGFSLSQFEICSSRNSMAPGWSLVKNVLQLVIRPVGAGPEAATGL